MDIAAYLERIGYQGELTPTLTTLRELQKEHLFHVPFENLDIHHSKSIELDTGKFYQKIVTNQRGGFCYELNGLFFELLKAMGFKAKLVSARAYDKERGFGNEFDHLAIIVEMEKRQWLADVGFGDFSFYPLPIITGKIITDPVGKFRFSVYDEVYQAISRKTEGGWQYEYIFSQKERVLSEFKDMCDFHQTSPLSHFTRKIVCSLPTLTGRITLTGDQLKSTNSGKVTTTPIKDELEFKSLLANLFGIKLD